MSQQLHAEFAALKQQLITHLSDQKSRNDAIVAANEDLQQQIGKLERRNGKLKRKNRKLEGQVETLQKNIEYLNKKLLRMENMVDEAESQRDALLEGTQEISEAFKRDLRKTHRDEIEYWTDALDSAKEHIKELEVLLQHRDFRIDELLDKVIGLHEERDGLGGNTFEGGSGVDI